MIFYFRKWIKCVPRTNGIALEIVEAFSDESSTVILSNGCNKEIIISSTTSN